MAAVVLASLIFALACAPEKPAAHEDATPSVQEVVQDQDVTAVENTTKSDNATPKSGTAGFECGSPAPEFTLTSYNHEAVTMSRLKGKNVLLISGPPGATPASVNCRSCSTITKRIRGTAC